MTSPWNPTQYERFRNERSQPFFDLLELVAPAPGGTAVDLGCGTGELTKMLHEKLRTRETIGLDSSETMLARSEAHHTRRPTQRARGGCSSTRQMPSSSSPVTQGSMIRSYTLADLFTIGNASCGTISIFRYWPWPPRGPRVPAALSANAN